jgi:hypothetical protein
MTDQYDTLEKKMRKDGTLFPEYSQEELEMRSKLIQRMNNALEERELPHAEFDEMTYSQYYDSNKRADMSYIPPKKNREEKRIVTGYTREKDNTLLSALLSYNYNADITAYDDSELIFPELGNNMEDLVKKSREIEQYQKLRPLIYRELISQGTVFVEEVWNIQRLPKYKGSWKPGQKIKDATFDKVGDTVIERAEIKLHQGKNVYLGSFWQDDYKKQDMVFTYEVIPRSLAQTIYGKWDRWECVPKTFETLVIQEGMYGYTYQDWNLTRVNEDQVGVIKVQLPFENKYMIFLNGVMLLPCDFPLTEISPDGSPTIKMQNLEGIVGCAYGKGQPSKTKVDQAVHDEFLKLMILGMEQSRKPTLGSRRKVVPKDLFTPGKVIPNVKENDFFPLIPEQGRLQPADFSMYQLIKQMIDDKTINATFSGEDQGQGKTATQIMQERQQQLMKLGLNFDAIKELEKELVWARIMNIIVNYPKVKKTVPNMEKKVIENVYNTFSVETTLTDGKQGVKVIEFTDKEFPDIREQQKEEGQLSEYYGKPAKKVYFNASKFIDLLKFRWIVNIVPTQEGGDIIEKELFIGNIREAKELFPGQVNDEYAKERFAIKIKEDPTKFFIGQEELQKMQQEMMMQGTAPAGVEQQGNGVSAPKGQMGVQPPTIKKL